MVGSASQCKSPSIPALIFPAFCPKPNWSDQLLQISNPTKKVIQMSKIMTWFMTVLLLYHHCMIWRFVYMFTWGIPQFSYFPLNALYEIKVRQGPKLPVEYPADPTTPYNHSPAWRVLFGLSQGKSKSGNQVSNFSHSAFCHYHHPTFMPAC